jgi:hypothetical protein
LILRTIDLASTSISADRSSVESKAQTYVWAANFYSKYSNFMSSTKAEASKHVNLCHYVPLGAAFCDPAGVSLVRHLTGRLPANNNTVLAREFSFY